jgi:hypothetical protein
VCRSIIGTVSQEPILFGTSIEAHPTVSVHLTVNLTVRRNYLACFVIPVNSKLEGLFVEDRAGNSVIEKLSKSEVSGRVIVLIVLVGVVK